MTFSYFATTNRVDQNANVVTSAYYNAYGARGSTNYDDDPYDGFGGQYGYRKDAGGAWVYLCGARYYSPDEARFVNRDPIGYAGGINLYSYVGNNPMNGVDPSGLIGSIIGLQPRNSISGYFEDRAPDFGGIGRKLRGYFEDRLPDREVLGYILERLNTFKDGAVQGFVCGLGDEGGSLYGLQSQSEASSTSASPTMPHNPSEVDTMTGSQGRGVPDGITTPGRNKTIWEPKPGVKITHEGHPYHPQAPAFHKDPHYHYDVPGSPPHQRVLPGEEIPDDLRRALGIP